MSAPSDTGDRVDGSPPSGTTATGTGAAHAELTRPGIAALISSQSSPAVFCLAWGSIITARARAASMRGGSCMPSAFAEMSVFGSTASSMHPMRPSPFRTFWSRSASSRTSASEYTSVHGPTAPIFGSNCSGAA